MKADMNFLKIILGLVSTFLRLGLRGTHHLPVWGSSGGGIITV